MKREGGRGRGDPIIADIPLEVAREDLERQRARLGQPTRVAGFTIGSDEGLAQAAPAPAASWFAPWELASDSWETGPALLRNEAGGGRSHGAGGWQGAGHWPQLGAGRCPTRHRMALCSAACSRSARPVERTGESCRGPRRLREGVRASRWEGKGFRRGSVLPKRTAGFRDVCRRAFVSVRHDNRWRGVNRRESRRRGRRLSSKTAQA